MSPKAIADGQSSLGGCDQKAQKDSNLESGRGKAYGRSVPCQKQSLASPLRRLNADGRLATPLKGQVV